MNALLKHIDINAQTKRDTQCEKLPDINGRQKQENVKFLCERNKKQTKRKEIEQTLQSEKLKPSPPEPNKTLVPETICHGMTIQEQFGKTKLDYNEHGNKEIYYKPGKPTHIETQKYQKTNTT